MFTNLAIQRGHHLAWLSRHPVAMTTAGPVRWFSWPLRRWLSRPCARMAQCCAGGIHTTPGAVELSWSWWCSGPSTRNGESLRKIFVYIIILVGGLEHFLFSPIAGMMIQSDSYFSEGLKPPTSICIYIYIYTYIHIFGPLKQIQAKTYIFVPFLGASNDGIHNIWGNPSHWLIFFRGVETTNQIIYIYNISQFFWGVKS